MDAGAWTCKQRAEHSGEAVAANVKHDYLLCRPQTNHKRRIDMHTVILHRATILQCNAVERERLQVRVGVRVLRGDPVTQRLNHVISLDF